MIIGLIAPVFAELTKDSFCASGLSTICGADLCDFIFMGFAVGTYGSTYVYMYINQIYLEF